MSINKYRDLIVGVDKPIPLYSGEKVIGINFDNAATTPPFEKVVKDIVKFSSWYSSVHRGTGYKSQLSSNFFDESRKKILDFIKADPEVYTVVFVKNTTEGINKLSYRLINNKDDVVISTWMEHHSNDLPWRDKCKIDYVEIDDDGKIIIEDLEEKLQSYKGKVKLVTVTGASNVTGYVNDVHKIAKLAHRYGARILVDGAQMVPHTPISMCSKFREENIDFLVFSAHKMYAPFGIGVIIAPKKCLKNGCPEFKGGGTVKVVTHDYVDWDEPPFKDEAGSPNLIGIKALITSLDMINKIGLKNIESYEKKLTDYAIEKLKKIPQIIFYGDTSPNIKRVSIITFNVKGIYHEDVAKYLSDKGGIAVRSGCFCAHPYVQRLLKLSKEELDKYRNNLSDKKPGMVRISFGLYNTYGEIDKFIHCIRKMIKEKEKMH